MPPFNVSCDINGIPASVNEDFAFSALIPLELGEINIIVAICSVVDSCGNETVCADSIVVLPPAPPVCTVEITSPADSSAVCGDSLRVTGLTMIEGNFPPFAIQCNVNGFSVSVDAAGAFSTTIPFDPTVSTILASCVVTDSCGTKVICVDSVIVVPPTPPVCIVEITSPADSSIVCGDSLRVTGVTTIESAQICRPTSYLEDPT